LEKEKKIAARHIGLANIFEKWYDYNYTTGALMAIAEMK